jgi:hypothetical protein
VNVDGLIPVSLPACIDRAHEVEVEPPALPTPPCITPDCADPVRGLADRSQPLLTWTTNVSLARLALPVTCQQPCAVNLIVLAQKCGARASPDATLARRGFAAPSSRLPAIRKSPPARLTPHHGNLVAIEPSRRSSPKTMPGGGGRVAVTTSLPSTGIWVHSRPLPKSVGLLVSPGGA